MKQYIGTKQVKAEPMTRTEAAKLLGREIKPAKAEYGEDGYLVEYEDGYKSWSPKVVFDKTYKPCSSCECEPICKNEEYVGDSSRPQFGFGEAISWLKKGAALRRAGWKGKGLFVVKQVPSHIGADIIPNMQSLPQSAKDILMHRDNPHIDYTNQMLIINPDGRADSWVPSSSDVFAMNWEVVE